MTWFKPGHVPAGWTKGRRLDVRQFDGPPGTLSTIEQQFNSDDLLGPGDSIRLDSVAFLTFRRDDPTEVSGVNEWLEWWRS